MAGQYECINYETMNRTAVITLNRPKAKNAVNAQLARELAEAMACFELDNDLLLGVLTGEGDVFCAGMDLKVFMAGQSDEVREIIDGPELRPDFVARLEYSAPLGVSTMPKGGQIKETLRTGFAGFVGFPRTKPIIAAVNGPALAGGFELVLACDMVIASEAACFGLPEPKVGLFAAAGGAFRLPQLIPAGKAMEMLLTGDPISAHQAHALGLVNTVYPAADLHRKVLELATRITKNAPYALKETYNLARASKQLNETAFWKESKRAWQRILTTEDAKEGPKAFIEKRGAKWKG